LGSNLVLDDDGLHSFNLEERDGPLSRTTSDMFLEHGNDEGEPADLVHAAPVGFWPADLNSAQPTAQVVSGIPPRMLTATDKSDLKPPRMLSGPLSRTGSDLFLRQMSEEPILNVTGLPSRMTTDRIEARPARLLSGPLSRTESDLFLRQRSEQPILNFSGIPSRMPTDRSELRPVRLLSGQVSRTSSEV